MSKKVQLSFAALTAVSILALTSGAFASNLIVNGDFENTVGWGAPGSFNCPDGWYSSGTSLKNPATIQEGAAAIGGSGTSAYMEAFKTTTTSERRQMGQAFSITPTGAEWNIAFDIAMDYPGAYPERGMQLILNPTSGSRMMFRIAESLDGTTGALEFYRGNQGSWTPLPGLESCLTLSNDLANSPLANNIAFTGHFDSATPTYDITVTNASGSVYTATGINWYESGAAPSEGSGLAYFTLPTFNSSTGNYVVDNFEAIVRLAKYHAERRFRRHDRLGRRRNTGRSLRLGDRSGYEEKRRGNPVRRHGRRRKRYVRIPSRPRNQQGMG